MSEDTTRDADAPESTTEHSVEGRLRHLARPQSFRICAAMAAGAQTVEALMGATGMPENSLGHHLRGLVCGGFVRRDRPPGAFCYRFALVPETFDDLGDFIASVGRPSCHPSVVRIPFDDPLDSATVVPSERMGVAR